MSGSHYSCYVELGTNKAYNGVGGLLLPQLSLEAVEYPTQSLQQTKRKTIAQTAMINLMKNKFINKKLDKYLIMCYYRKEDKEKLAGVRGLANLSIGECIEGKTPEPARCQLPARRDKAK